MWCVCVCVHLVCVCKVGKLYVSLGGGRDLQYGKTVEGLE